jgi:prefoldin alpha subunit
MSTSPISNSQIPRSRQVRIAPTQKPDSAISEQQIQEQFNQLVGEVRLLEAYYQEVVARQQSVSAALVDTRAALDAIDTISKSESNELLVPIGGGTLMFATSSNTDKLILSVGAGVAIEKSRDYAKTFLQGRRQELERAVSSLEGQRKEIGSRLEVGRATIQRIAGAQQ